MLCRKFLKKHNMLRIHYNYEDFYNSEKLTVFAVKYRQFALCGSYSDNTDIYMSTPRMSTLSTVSRTISANASISSLLQADSPANGTVSRSTNPWST